MATELRVAFAMGGGVSLGAYSGAALTEALKWMIVEAAQEGSHYDRVVVDVFSGSSAGSMALVLLLRALASPGSVELEGFDDPEGRLREQFGAKLDAFDDPDKAGLKDALLAAQKAQDLQEYVWVRAPEIDLGHLLGVGSDRDLRHEAGLLDRGAVETIASDWLSLPEGEDFDDKQILGDRVLFAATLGRLTPLIADARTEFGEASEGAGLTDLVVEGFKKQGLVDGLTSKIYRDLRIFDLNFPSDADAEKAPGSWPTRWIRYQSGLADAPERPAPERPAALEDSRAWSTLAATAIASGAFPVAFAPVVLRRYAFEYGPYWPAELADAEDYLFSFVDGGTFNNEPIREAVQLASYLDASTDPEDGDSFSRRVIFVDPLVNDLKIDHRLGVYQRNLLEKPNLFGSLDGYDLRQRTTLDRLLPQVGTLVSAIFNEARSIGADEQYLLDQRSECRHKLHRILETALRLDAGGEARELLEDFCTQILSQERQNLAFPSGSLSLQEEIARVQVTGRDPVVPDEEPEEPGPTPALSADERYLDSLLAVALDLAMGLAGRRKHTALVGIAPFSLQTGHRYELPAEAIQGFAGFASLQARGHAAILGRHCALESLVTCQLLPKSHEQGIGPAPAAPSREEIRPELEAGLEAINRRLEEVIETSHLSNFAAGLDRQVLRLLSSVITSQTKNLLESAPETTSYEVRLKVPEGDDSFRLRDPGGIQAQKPSIPAGETEPHLVTFIEWVEEEPEEVDQEEGAEKKGTWKGPHIENGKLRVDRARSGDRDAVAQHLALPGRDLLEQADRLPYPVFRQTLGQTPGSIPADRWRIHNPLQSLDEQLVLKKP